MDVNLRYIIRPTYRVARWSQLLGAMSLMLFLVLHYGVVGLLMFGDRDLVQNFMQSQTLPVVVILQVICVIAPLLFHVAVSLMQSVRVSSLRQSLTSPRTWSLMFYKLSLFVILAFAVYHVVQIVQFMINDSAIVPVIGEVLFFHSSPALTVVYWIALLLCVFYFLRLCWLSAIDFGLIPSKSSQRTVGLIGVCLFAALAVATGFALYYQLMWEVV